MKRRLAMVTLLAALLVLAVAIAPAAALDEADRLFLVGERALADRFYPVARRALERFVTQFPNDARVPKALLMLGKARLAVGDSQSALDALQRAAGALTTPADQLEAKFWQAEALVRLKRLAEARSAYDEVIRADATSPLAANAQYGIGWIDMELKRPESAVTALRELLNTSPQHDQAPPASLLLARALIELKRFGEAQPVLSGFATKYPASSLIPDAQFLLGWVKVHDGDPQGGLTDLRAFVAANPKHAQVKDAQGLIAKVAGQHGSRAQKQEAYTAFMQDPVSAEGLVSAAAIAKELGRAKEADAAWRKLRSEFPDHPETRRMALEHAAAAFKQKNYKDAATLGQSAAQSSESRVRAEALLIVGESELKLERFPQAAKAFEGVGAVSDVEAGARDRALAGLGLAREKQKDWKAALAAYEVVASRSRDATLRDWARERAAAMKTQLKSNDAPPASPKRTEPGKPADKPAGRKS
jgi:TolA-binding protein